MQHFERVIFEPFWRQFFLQQRKMKKKTIPSASSASKQQQQKRPISNISRASSVPPSQQQQQQPQVSNSSSSVQQQQRKKGDLCFKCNFESGNLSKVVIAGDGEYDLYIRPDTNNAMYRLWFYFAVSNTKKQQKVIFTICNFSKARSLYRQGMSPLVKSDSRNSWERIPDKCVFYYRSNKHKNNVLSFAFMFDKEDDVYYFAYCFPYTYENTIFFNPLYRYTDLQKYLYFVEQKNFSFWKRQVIARTEHHRRLDLLTISENVFDEAALAKKKAIFITSRVHPGETPSSFVCHGLMAYLISDAAKQLREMCVFYIVPMLNPDGVFLGNYRCSASGYDLNRVWLNPLEYVHPTIVATRNLLLQLKEKVDVDFFIDIHSHSNATSGFMYMNHMNNDTQFLFPKLLDYKAKEFSFADSRCCKDPSKLGTGRRALGEMLQVAKHCYTLEVSFYGYTDLTSSMKCIPFTEENYMDLGKNLGITFLDYYTTQLPAVSSVRSKK